MFEFYRMAIPRGIGEFQKSLGILSGILLNLFIFAVIYFAPFATLGLALFTLSFLAIFISSLYVKLEKPFKVLSYVITGIFYVALPFSLMSLWTNSSFYLEEISFSGLTILAYFIILWSNDVGAYCFGMTIGRLGNHKLFPRHSPKKTWEGFVGGVLVAMLASYLVGTFLLEDDRIVYWLGLGLIVSVFATFGDLLESMLKRSVGVKDSGNIMPGHGGILDRFDGVLLSFLPAAIYTLIY